MDTTASRAALHDDYGNPVVREIEAFDLRVEGALPRELCGTYVRNGPNPRTGASPMHLFVGEGMLHGLRLENGRAAWYRNRWVRTRSFEDPRAKYVRWNGTLDLRVGPANTSVVAHAGRLFALVESSLPYEVAPDLTTLGPYDFEGKLKTPFTAHPKRCPRTGELHAFGMSVVPGRLTYHRIAASGALLESRPIPTRGTTLMHDFALTERYAVFMDLPVVFDMTRARGGTMPYRWSDTYGARVGVALRDDGRAPVRWFDVAPCYVFHVLNAFETDAAVVLDVVRYSDVWRDGAADFGTRTLHRWTFDLARGSVRETTLDERPLEFPRCDDRRAGRSYRYGYAIETDGKAGGVVRKYDLASGSSSEHDFGFGQVPGEAVFVPYGDAEDAGWLLCFVYDATAGRSYFAVLDATDVVAEPVATVSLPQRVPLGFHGSWFDDAALGG